MMRLLTIIVAFALLVLQGAPAHADEMSKALVLAAGNGTSIAPLSVDDVRSIFMGAPVVRGNLRLRPVLNETDPLLREVFLQKVMFVSWKHYQRRLVEESFRSGWPMPEIVTDTSALARTLREQPGTVTYMWESNARSLGVKIIQVLWSGPVN